MSLWHAFKGAAYLIEGAQLSGIPPRLLVVAKLWSSPTTQGAHHGTSRRRSPAVLLLTFRKAPEKDQGLGFSLGQLTLVRVCYVNAVTYKSLSVFLMGGHVLLLLSERGGGEALSVALSSSGFSKSFPLSWWVCIRGSWTGGLFHSDFKVSI